MVEYYCIRCGYFTEYKSHFVRHLTKKLPCPPNVSDISIKELQKMNGIDINKHIFQKKTEYKCEACQEYYSSKYNLKKHILRKHDVNGIMEKMKEELEELKFENSELKYENSELKHENKLLNGETNK